MVLVEVAVRQILLNMKTHKLATRPRNIVMSAAVVAVAVSLLTQLQLAAQKEVIRGLRLVAVAVTLRLAGLAL